MVETQGDMAGESRSRPMRTVMLVSALLIMEAALIVGLMMVLGGKPDVAGAGQTLPDEAQIEDERIVEVLVLDAKLPNAKTGVTYLYDTEIYVQVKQKYAERTAQEFEQFYNEIKADITAIWRTSDPRHFQEPKLENLTRKVYALLNGRVGMDQDDGEPILIKCVIVMGTGFRVDS